MTTLKIVWGKITGFDGSTYKDAKLKGRVAEEWIWSKGMHHVPGILIADLENWIDSNTSVVILSQGMDNVLKTDESTFKFLQEKSITVYQLNSRDAVQKYNELVDELGNSLIGMFHSTC